MCAEFLGLSLFVIGAVPRQNNNFHIGVVLLYTAQRLDAVDNRHHQIQDNYVRLFFFEHLEGLLAVVRNR